MKIGLMAYHSACNFGASLQLTSTYMYLRNHGHQPIVINWVADDLDLQYAKAPEAQAEMQKNLRRQVWTETTLCRTDEDVANAIKENGIEAVIIGSDAVCQHHTVRERLIFPCKRLFAIEYATKDRLFPNPFWATWNRLLDNPVPVAILSASSQDSAYQYFSPSLCSAMEEQVRSYSYLSVRDQWTCDMFAHITKGRIVPEVTPDPVFAFSYNADAILPTKEELMKKYDLPERYVLMSFINGKTVSDAWLREFEALAEKDGMTCIKLPFSESEGFGELKHQIHLPLSPLEWFALIKHSQGYIGHNMHPIVVSLHTNVPFFSFDNYGLKRFNGLVVSDKSSKIKHILELAGMTEYRVSCISKRFTPPSPADVYNRFRSFDKGKSKAFALSYYVKYQQMMSGIINALESHKD